MTSEIEGGSAHGSAEIGLDVLADLPDFSDNMLEHMDSNKTDEGGFQTEIPLPQPPGLGFRAAPPPNPSGEGNGGGTMRSERDDSSGTQTMDPRQLGGGGAGGVSNLYGGGGGGGPPPGSGSMEYPHGPPHPHPDVNEEAHRMHHHVPHQPRQHSHWPPYGSARATPHDGGSFHPQNPPNHGGGHGAPHGSVHPGSNPEPYHARHHAPQAHDGGEPPGGFGVRGPAPGYHHAMPHAMPHADQGGTGTTGGVYGRGAPPLHHGGGINLGYGAYPPPVRHAPGPGGGVGSNPPHVNPMAGANAAEQRGQTPPPPRSGVMAQGVPHAAPPQQWAPTPHFWGGHMGPVNGRPMEMTREDAARKVGHSQDAAAEGFPVWGWQPGQGWTGPVESMKEQTDKRRQDRNNREQKRSKRISDQIKELKVLLEQSGVSTSKGNKSSVLTCAADFIADLQRQNAALARENTHAQQRGFAEQQQQPNHPPHVVGCGGGNSPPHEGGEGAPNGGDRRGSPSSSTGGGSDDGMGGSSAPQSGPGGGGQGNGGHGASRGPGHVETDEEERGAGQQQQRGGVANLRSRVDYQRVFHDQGMPMAITSVDGRFLDCNWRFERESGYSKDDLLHMTFFTLARSDGDANIFHLVAEMLKVSRQEGSKECIVRAVLKHEDDQQMEQEQQPRFLKLSTVHEHEGSSDVKFFSCALLHSSLTV